MSNRAPESHKLCSLPAIEARMSSIKLVVTLLSAAASALSLLFSTPLLSRGRKKVLLAGVLGTALTNVPFITISAGYLSLSPDLPPVINSEKVVVALIIGLTLLNLLGLDDLPLLSCRVLLNDQSSANERTRNLNWLSISYLSGLSIAPVFVSALCQLLPSILDTQLHLREVDYSAKEDQYHRESADKTVQWSPTFSLRKQGGEINVMPFIVAMFVAIVGIFWTLLCIPESARLNVAEEVVTVQQGSVSSRSKWKQFFRVSVLSILTPRSLPGDVSSRDWRLLRLAVVAQLAGAGTLGLDSLLYFVGYSLQWSTSQVNLFISWIGTIRTIVLLLIAPALLVYLTRHTTKPRILRSLNEDQLEILGKISPEIDADQIEVVLSGDDLFNQNQVDPASQSDPDERERYRLRQVSGMVSELRRDMILWRSRIDFKLLKISIFFDLVGWLIAVVGGQCFSHVTTVLGGALLSFGAPTSSTFYSVGVATAIDMHRKGLDVGATAQIAADSFVGAIAFLDALFTMWAPLAHTMIYKASLGSILPGAPFLLSALLYFLAFVLVISSS